MNFGRKIVKLFFLNYIRLLSFFFIVEDIIKSKASSFVIKLFKNLFECMPGLFFIALIEIPESSAKQGILNFLKPVKIIRDKLIRLSGTDIRKGLESYDCHKNPKKAEAVAVHLVNNWHYAHLIAKSNQSKFYAVFSLLYPTYKN